ncbi:conserved hypothetical protein [uncultured Desulfobacterium sp.]|uniref:Uncharacterized protein n=1 Tax=uncultured Desulfobacterium sp. TaxID=201089 RepID=A0A445MT66_9BACT|nr:conserved hypothetical protein [uncultured Desulfobacterium sp.]
MPYGWKIEYNGNDISDKVTGFSITANLESYCREMTLDIADRDFYNSLDFSQISEDPEIEIFTKVENTFISQGLFFIERPAIASTVQSDILQGVWGRSITAKLSDPFAPKVNKVWDSKTTFYSVCAEMCTMAGLTWDEAYSGIDDYVILANTYEADGLYPVDVITELAGFAGALVTTDRSGHVCIKRIDYAPAVADATIADVDLQGISETPEWPEFGNRVKITPTGSVSGYSLELTIPDVCLPADGETRIKLYALVKDEDGNPVNGIITSWSADTMTSLLAYATANTRDIRINREQKRASNYYSVKVDFPPSSVDGVWAYSDTARKNNLAADGYIMDGNTITLAKQLAYCDQLLVIDYWSSGVAVNHIYAGSTTEDVTVTVSLEGETDKGIVYIDNPCQCPANISLRASPTEIHIGEEALLLVYMEDSGPVENGRVVYMTELGSVEHGLLAWEGAHLGPVIIQNEETAAINEVAGVTQCELSMYPESVTSIYETTEDENGNKIPTGSNLYASNEGKTVSLNTILISGTPLLAEYVAVGAVVNRFTGTALGTASLKAWADSSREAGLEATCQVKVVDETSEGTETRVIYYGEGDEFDEKKEPEPAPTCAPENVSDVPTDNALSGRFAGPRGQGCSCEEMCDQEIGVYGTTQNYEGASYRKISDIVTEDYNYAEGTPEYWGKYNELKTAALNACMDQCSECGTPLAWGSNPETIAPGTSVLISVTGGKGPFFWSVSGPGFSLATNGVSESNSNLLIADENACGSATITVTDDCGFDVTGYVRSTVGVWCLTEECVHGSTPPQGVTATVEEIRGKYKYVAIFCYTYTGGACGYCAGCMSLGSCDTPLTPPPTGTVPSNNTYCCCQASEAWEWKCTC